MKKIKNLKYFLGFIVLAVLSYLYLYDFKITQKTENKIKDSINENNKIIVYKKEDVAALIEKHLKIVNFKTEIETVTKKQIKYSYLNKYPDMLNCNSKLNSLPKWSPIDKQIPINEYVFPALNETFKDRYVRGVLVYFPIEKSNEFMGEFKWFYR
jgi:hypothetical protein